jgi:hypothetical protein
MAKVDKLIVTNRTALGSKYSVVRETEGVLGEVTVLHSR